MQTTQLDESLWKLSLEGRSSWKCQRYKNIPADLSNFLCSFSNAETIDGKAWILSASDFSAQDDREFSFDFIESLSLEAADDEEWKSEIKEFWDKHLPVYISIEDGYEYIAYDLSTGNLVNGHEPEFEETSVVADSIIAFISYINRKHT